MTGFGRTEAAWGDTTLNIDIRSLNGKQLDINLKIPPLLKPFEFEIRNLLQQQLIRGSLEVTVVFGRHGALKPVVVNVELAKQYYQSIAALARELSLPQQDVLGALLKLPEVVTASTETLGDDDWSRVEQALLTAVGEVDKHRLDEGAVLEKDLQLRIANIESLQARVSAQEPHRKDRIRQRMEGSLLEWVGREGIDKNRLEQELIYYIEKLDISEEQVRLLNHCRYFKEILAGEEKAKGKKLNFVLQEIGREINTTGSKANDAEIQQWVVQMKDELEKAKEQILNIL